MLRRRGVLAFAAGAAFFFYAFVLRVAPSVMIDELMRDFAAGGAIIGQLSAFYFYAYAGLQIPVGVLLDRFGARGLLSGAAVLAALGSVVFAASGGVAVASLGRLAMGFGSAFSWIGLLVIAAYFFPARRFALLTGIGQLVGVAGGILGQAPLGTLVGAIGWRGASLAVAALGLVVAASLWLTAPARRPSEAAGGRGALQRLRAVSGSRQTWLYAFIAMSLTAPILAFAGLWAVPYFETRYGLGRAEAAAMASVFSVGWCVGAPTLGGFFGRAEHRRVLLFLAASLLSLLLCALLYLPGLGLGAIGALAFGIGFAGSAMTVTFAGARECNAPDSSGAALGLVNTCVMASGALYQPLIGLLLDWQWQGGMAAGARLYGVGAYSAALAVLPATAAVAAIATLLLRGGRAAAAPQPAGS